MDAEPPIASFLKSTLIGVGPFNGTVRRRNPVIKLLKILGERVGKSDLVGQLLDGDQVDVIIWPNRRWPRMGVVFRDEALVLDYRTFMSFRVRSGNLGYSEDLRLGKYRGQLDKAYLAVYFDENRDNPYALYHVMRMIYAGQPLTGLTQFPPLTTVLHGAKEHALAVETLIGKAELGDVVFSSTPNDAVSSLIRSGDQGQFSHCATYVGNGNVCDAGPSGVVLNCLRDYPPQTRLALYRLRTPLTDEQKSGMAGFAKRQAEKGCGYNYWGVVKVFLRKRLRLPIPNTAPSISDLLYSNEFRLVDFT